MVEASRRHGRRSHRHGHRHGRYTHIKMTSKTIREHKKREAKHRLHQGGARPARKMRKHIHRVVHHSELKYKGKANMSKAREKKVKKAHKLAKAKAKKARKLRKRGVLHHRKVKRTAVDALCKKYGFVSCSHKQLPRKALRVLGRIHRRHRHSTYNIMSATFARVRRRHLYQRYQSCRRQYSQRGHLQWCYSRARSLERRSEHTYYRRQRRREKRRQRREYADVVAAMTSMGQSQASARWHRRESELQRRINREKSMVHREEDRLHRSKRELRHMMDHDHQRMELQQLAKALKTSKTGMDQHTFELYATKLKKLWDGINKNKAHKVKAKKVAPRKVHHRAAKPEALASNHWQEVAGQLLTHKTMNSIPDKNSLPFQH